MIPLLHCKLKFLCLSIFIEIVINNSGEIGEITTTHLLLGIWSEKDSAGHKILASLGFDDEKAKELSKDVSFKVLLFFLSNYFIFVTLMIDLQNSNYLILAPCRWTRIML